MNPASEVITAAAALSEWLGEGGRPVNPVLAELRAQRCLIGNNGKPCPLNKEPNWWGRFKHVVADWIRAQLEVKSEMKLTVRDEEQLNMCAACGCCLRLKVWVPPKHLRSHTDPTILNKVPAYCWLKREIKPQKSR